jgi:hypothetical protein
VLLPTSDSRDSRVCFSQESYILSGRRHASDVIGHHHHYHHRTIVIMERGFIQILVWVGIYGVAVVLYIVSILSGWCERREAAGGVTVNAPRQAQPYNGKTSNADLSSTGSAAAEAATSPQPYKYVKYSLFTLIWSMLRHFWQRFTRFWVSALPTKTGQVSWSGFIMFAIGVVPFLFLCILQHEGTHAMCEWIRSGQRPLAFIPFPAEIFGQIAFGVTVSGFAPGFNKCSTSAPQWENCVIIALLTVVFNLRTRALIRLWLRYPSVKFCTVLYYFITCCDFLWNTFLWVDSGDWPRYQQHHGYSDTDFTLLTCALWLLPLSHIFWVHVSPLSWLQEESVAWLTESDDRRSELRNKKLLLKRQGASLAGGGSGGSTGGGGGGNPRSMFASIDSQTHAIMRNGLADHGRQSQQQNGAASSPNHINSPLRSTNAKDSGSLVFADVDDDDAGIDMFRDGPDDGMKPSSGGSATPSSHQQQLTRSFLEQRVGGGSDSISILSDESNSPQTTPPFFAVHNRSSIPSLYLSSSFSASSPSSFVAAPTFLLLLAVAAIVVEQVIQYPTLDKDIVVTYVYLAAQALAMVLLLVYLGWAWRGPGRDQTWIS